MIDGLLREKFESLISLYEYNFCVIYCVVVGRREVKVGDFGSIIRVCWVFEVVEDEEYGEFFFFVDCGILCCVGMLVIFIIVYMFLLFVFSFCYYFCSVKNVVFSIFFEFLEILCGCFLCVVFFKWKL